MGAVSVDRGLVSVAGVGGGEASQGGNVAGVAGVNDALHSCNGTKSSKYSSTTFELLIVRLLRLRTNRMTIDSCCVPLMSRHSLAINA